MAESDKESIEIDAPEESAKKDPKKASKRKGAEVAEAKKAEVKKIRLTLEEAEDGRLTTLTNQLKDRGIKTPDLAPLVSEALEQMSDEWWAEKLEELTPLEWKVQAALENPDMREKLMSLLEGQQ